MNEGNSLHIRFPVTNVMGSKTEPHHHIHVKLLHDCDITINNLKRETVFVTALSSESEWVKNLFFGNPKPIKASMLDMCNRAIYQVEATAVTNLEFQNLAFSMLPVLEEEKALNTNVTWIQRPAH
jgi:hypothetical protein